MGDQFALKNNQIFVLAEAAGGVYNSDQLRILCEVADNESAFLKITEDQRIGFMVDPHRLADVQAHVRKSGLLLRSYKSSGVPSPRACLGELCTFAHQPSLGDALELTTHLLKSFPAPKRYSTIGVNGCQRACLGSSTEDIHIVAEESGYKVSIGGKGSDIPQQAQLILENISRTDLPVVVEKILAVFYQESQDNERIVDVIERIGLTPFFDALPEHITPVQNDLPEVTSQNDAVTDDTTDEIAGSLLINESATGADFAKTTDEALDDLVETSAAEFAHGDDSGLPVTDNSDSPREDALLDIALLDDDHEPEVDIQLPEQSTQELHDGLEGVGLEVDLLEVAESDLEEGSSEDVERVREAIRTELSMSLENDREISPQTNDLLDELDSELPVDDLHVGDSEVDELAATALEDSADDLLADSRLTENSRFVADTAAHLEHQKPSGRSAPKKQTRESSWATHSEPSPAPVGGRLSIRFVNDQLAVELPSGLSFELPFESVANGGELAMSLPDGDLRIQRDGQMLAVQLGMLSLKIPIPQGHNRNAA